MPRMSAKAALHMETIETLLKEGKYQAAIDGLRPNRSITMPGAFFYGDEYYARARARLALGQMVGACSDLEAAEQRYFNEARIVRRDEVRRLLAYTRSKVDEAGH